MSLALTSANNLSEALLVTFVALEVARSHHDILFVTDGFGSPSSWYPFVTAFLGLS